MKINCPVCKGLVLAENINLQSGWGKCAACNDVFPLRDVLPDFKAGGAAKDGRVERPFNARAVVERSPQELIVHIPAMGMRAGLWALLGFGIFWTGFIAFWTAGALGVFFGNQPGGPAVPNILFACFSIPFWIAGFGMLGGVVWMARSTRFMQMDSSAMTTQTRCLGWSRMKQVELARVQHARPYDPPIRSSSNSNGAPNAYMQRYSVEVVYEKGSYVLPAESRDEQRWLIHEINDSLKAIR